MYRYEVEFKYNLGTGSNTGSRSMKVETTFPRKIYAFGDCYGNDGKGRNEILTKAANELGLDPSRIEAIADRNKLDGGWYKLIYLGEVKNNLTSEAISKQISQQVKEAHYAANKERLEEERNREKIVTIHYRKCYQCNEKYEAGTGVQWSLRLNNSYRNYEYCGDYCAKKHFESDDYVWVNSNGYTLKEQGLINEKRRQEIEKAENLKKEEEKRRAIGESQQIIDYGPWLILAGTFLSGIFIFNNIVYSMEDFKKTGILFFLFWSFYLCILLFYPKFISKKIIKNEVRQLSNKKKILILSIFIFMLLSFTYLAINKFDEFNIEEPLMGEPNIENIEKEQAFEKSKSSPVKSTKLKQETPVEKKIVQPLKKEIKPWEKLDMDKETYDQMLKDGYIEE